MIHLMKYRLKIMMRNRAMMFWTFLFPLVLMTMFGLILRSSFSYTEFDTIPIAIVENEAWNDNQTLQQVIKEAKTNDHPLFNVKITSKEKAEALLNKDRINAYIVCDNGFDVHVKTSGFQQTIVQTFFDEYLHKTSMVETLMKKGAGMEQIQGLFNKTIDYVNENGEDNTDMTNVYFYTGLAMSAMFGGMWSVQSIIDIQADQSEKGCRIALAPVNKGMHMISSLILNLCFVFLTLLIQFTYIYLFFDVNFKAYTPYMILLLLVGDIGGSALGSFVGAVVKTKDSQGKIGIMSAITMFGSFLSGMMVIELKWIIYHFAPVINYINPVSMITDGLYSIYYYGIGERFLMNIISLLIFSAVCYVLAYIVLSKQQFKAIGGNAQ